MDTKIIQFKIVGLLTSEAFQKCKSYSLRLQRHVPEMFAPPKMRPMLDVQWTDFLTKSRRNFGTRLWMFDTPVIVFKNGELFGSEGDFVKYCNIYFRLHIFKDFEKAGEKQLQQYIESSERTHIFFMISIKGIVIGTLLFQLYTDLVPLTCANFLRLCRKGHKGYKGAPVHRVVPTSWIQIGGYNLKRHRIPCENYYVPHDQRGVLSMCNTGKHKNNNTQFFISLDPTPWMDYYYVAFGQLIHGEDVLQKIESVPLHYESPKDEILVEDCGEYVFHHEPDKKFLKDYEEYIHNFDKQELEGIYDKIVERETVRKYPKDIVDLRDVPSNFSIRKFKKGFYSI